MSLLFRIWWPRTLDKKKDNHITDAKEPLKLREYICSTSGIPMYKNAVYFICVYERACVCAPVDVSFGIVILLLPKHGQIHKVRAQQS